MNITHFEGVPDLKIELEKSDYINYRNELMRTSRIPKLSEAKATLGEPLAKIVFDECDEALKVDFGLKPPLKGAQGELWVSPSDLLRGKVALKPPVTRKYIQALTHEGIINIGADVELKFRNEAEAEKEKALAVQRKHMLDSFEDSTKAEIKDVEARERAAAQREIERISQEFEVTLIEELDKLQKKLEAEFEYLNQNQEKIIQEKWERKLEQEVQKTVNSMTEQFLVELSKHEDILTKYMKMEMSKAEVKRQFDLGTQAAKNQEDIQHLKHNLECKNIANMMYILCMERRKCSEEKHTIENFYKQEIEKHRKCIDAKDTEIKRKASDLEKQIKEVKLRETCVVEILRQFQKFINFALRAAPTQAEFLLSVEKMMVFELTDTLTKMELPKHDIPLPCEEYLSWRLEEKQSESSKLEGLHIPDYHDCFNEVTPPETPGEEPAYLPAFHYKNKLYVREDFRNMMSQGMRISSSSELWSKDVEILIETLRSSVHSFKEVNEESDSLLERASIKNINRSNDSKLRFAAKTQKGSKKVSQAKEDMQKEHKTSLKPIGERSVIDYNKIGDVEKSPFLLGTHSSIELTIKKGSVKHTGAIKKKASVVEEDTEVADVKVHTADGDRAKKKKGSVIKEDEEVVEVKDQPEYENIDENWSMSSKDESSVSLKVIAEKHPETFSDKGSRNLALEVRDSIARAKMAPLQKSSEFDAEVRDSVELAKEPPETKVTRTISKLVTARDSVQMLHESLSKIRDLKPPCVPSKREPGKTKSSSSGNSSTCCDKCQHRSIHSEELLKDTVLEKPRRRSLDPDRAIKISNIEVINVVDYETRSNVAFKTSPTVVDTSSNDFGSDGLPSIYKPKESQPSKEKRSSRINSLLKKKPTTKVIGDRHGKEYMQKPYEFAEERVRSLIALIRDHPNLIRTFTACTR